METSITSVLIDILILVTTAGITWVGWYLQKRWGIEKSKAIMEKVKIAVGAAEMIGASIGWSGSQKKQYVLEQVGRTLKINADELNRYLEAAVAAMKSAGDELDYKEVKVGNSNEVKIEVFPKVKTLKK